MSSGILKAPSAAAIRQLTTDKLRSMCWFYGGGKTGEPGEKPSKHGRDQLQQLYSHEFQVFLESTRGYTQVVTHPAITPSDWYLCSPNKEFSFNKEFLSFFQKHSIRRWRRMTGHRLQERTILFPRTLGSTARYLAWKLLIWFHRAGNNGMASSWFVKVRQDKGTTSSRLTSKDVLRFQHLLSCYFFTLRVVHWCYTGRLLTQHYCAEKSITV